MNKITFSKNSWHRHMVETYFCTTFYDDSIINLCQYIRWVIASILICVMLVTLFFGAMFVLIINPIIILTISVMCGGFVASGISELATFGAFLLIFTFVCWAVEHAVPWLRGRIAQHKQPRKSKKNSFLKEAYKSFKNKYCAYITFE